MTAGNNHRPVCNPGQLRRALASGRFVVTAEIGPPRIPNILLLTGDHPRFGDHPDAKAVFDIDGVQLVWTARTMRDQGRLLSGRRVDPAPQWLIGTVENPFSPPISFRARRLAKKVAAGAEFVQTQFVFDFGIFERFMSDVRDLASTERVGSSRAWARCGRFARWSTSVPRCPASTFPMP